jgi:hypothetical protein
MLQIGMIVKILPDAEYSGKFKVLGNSIQIND